MEDPWLVVSTGTAAGVDNPTAVRVADLALIPAAAANDVLRRTRRRLVREHGFTAAAATANDDGDASSSSSSASSSVAEGWGVPTVYVPTGSNVLARSVHLTRLVARQ